jgi:pyruvate,water dikinase
MTNAVTVAKEEAYVVPFEQLRMTDVEIVGGKNASLGEMISQLAEAGVRVASPPRHWLSVTSCITTI